MNFSLIILCLTFSTTSMSSLSDCQPSVVYTNHYCTHKFANWANLTRTRYVPTQATHMQLFGTNSNCENFSMVNECGESTLTAIAATKAMTKFTSAVGNLCAGFESRLPRTKQSAREYKQPVLLSERLYAELQPTMTGSPKNAPSEGMALAQEAVDGPANEKTQGPDRRTGPKITDLESMTRFRLRIAIVAITQDDYPPIWKITDVSQSGQSSALLWHSCVVRPGDGLQSGARFQGPTSAATNDEDSGRAEAECRIMTRCESKRYPADVSVEITLLRGSKTVLSYAGTVSIDRDQIGPIVRSADQQFLILFRWDEV